MKNADKPAYPRSGYEHSNLAYNARYYHEDGLTKREMFAMAAMQALLQSHPDQIHNEYQGVATAIKWADELLKQLESPKSE